MLEPVVEQMHRRSKPAFRQPPGQVAVGIDHHGDALERPREHHRLVTRVLDIGSDPGEVAHDRHAITRRLAGIAPAEDRRSLAGLPEQPRHAGGEWRLSTSARREAAYADDRPVQDAAPRRVRLVPPAAPSGDRRIERIDQLHSTSRN